MDLRPMDENKPKPEKDPETGRFISGNIGGGRPKGARSHLGEVFLEALRDDFVEHGVAAIAKVRDEKPDQYLKVIASILPRDLNINVNQMDNLTDDQLIERIRALDATIRPFLDSQGENGIGDGIGAPTAH
jgi:hypothetical protein